MSEQRRILVVDDEANIRESVQRALERVGHAVETVGDAAAASARLERGPFDLVLCDIRLPDRDGLDLLLWIVENHPDAAVVMMTAYASIESVVTAMKAGAVDYLPKPFTPEQVRHVVAIALEQQRLRDENRRLKAEIREHRGDRILDSADPGMQRLFQTARAVATADSSVLIVGESGTGKEVLARYIHGESARATRAFVAVNCAAIPANLLESELFGHRRGAFTGAVYSRRGSFELASGGTLLLDEIAEMPLEMQAKILRALESRQIQRVGSEEPISVDVRIIAATNRDPEHEVRERRFRQDLYFRINVVELAVPPLRERRADIVSLARHFAAVFQKEQKKVIADFSEDALEALVRYPWPGNVRELRNAIERAVLFAEPEGPIRLGHLPPPLRQAGNGTPARAFSTLRELEEQYIREVLDACAGNRTRAAEILGVSPVTLWRRLGRDA